MVTWDRTATTSLFDQLFSEIIDEKRLINRELNLKGQLARDVEHIKQSLRTLDNGEGDIEKINRELNILTEIEHKLKVHARTLLLDVENMEVLIAELKDKISEFEEPVESGK